MLGSFLLLLLAFSAIPLAFAADAGSFNVLTFNVAGLPSIISGNDVPGDKTTNSRTIGSKFAEYDYDVIHVQEDFNYHAYIYETDDHPYRTSTSGGVPFGSGLNTLSNFNWISFDRITWDQCNINDGDCLTPKGFTAMRMQIDEGVYIDFYNLHADAGSDAGDVDARRAGVVQMINYIEANSLGNAVIVFGDTNDRYTNTGVSISMLTTEVGLTDSWVQLINGGNTPVAGSPANACGNPAASNQCEIVDKVLYRGSRAINLSVTGWTYESSKFVQPDGNILSDHNPITVDFSWSRSSTIRQSNLSGGPHGYWFNDIDTIPSSSTGANKPSKITFRGASRLDSVALTLASGTAYTHGGTGGSAAELTLGASEYWTQARLCRGQKDGLTRNFYIVATTSSGRTLSAGSSTSDCSDFAAPIGWQIVGFHGRSGDEVDLLGFLYAPI
ncbi:uncharacterized protein A1O9_05608 [Exophiala aquamarina CBS 119918]|uniref:Jacalin-type lectin domain-containing protein n=1 Tax=Exophiala aquamarina CBS 119918 TaxID=1182545 RepID=A0A072PQA6_9EURO|nr:uncharacterized protein A1O9_05608 [Exophiala aquamarina CBS 119918]KEF57690.1 hypothetical protein A1O9_05608 [Exophiala aquamarina CBS 119918]